MCACVCARAESARARESVRVSNLWQELVDVVILALLALLRDHAPWRASLSRARLALGVGLSPLGLAFESDKASLRAQS